MKIPLSFYIDVSGQPTQEIYVGMCSIRPDYLTSLIKQIRKDRPEFLRHNFKGSKLQASRIKSYIHYLNGQKIRMVCVRFKTNSWNDFRKYLEDKKYWKELIYASLYFTTIKQYAERGMTYPLVVCKESYLDIEKVKNYLKKIAKAHGIYLEISDGHASQNDMIKIADIIASVGRKLSDDIKGLENYREICPSIEQPKFYIEKIK